MLSQNRGGALILPMLMLAVSSLASEYKYIKATDTAQLLSELKKSGFAVDSVSCINQGCAIVFTDGENKDPSAIVSAHIPANTTAERLALLEELAGIEVKLDDGTATIADLRRWAKIQMKITGTARRP